MNKKQQSLEHRRQRVTAAKDIMTNNSIKLYLIDLYEAYSAYEKGVNAVRNLPQESPYYKYHLLEEAEVELPKGFTLEKTQGDGEEIFKGNEAAEMVTEYDGKKFVTELITSEGNVKLYTWSWNYGN